MVQLGIRAHVAEVPGEGLGLDRLSKVATRVAARKARVLLSVAINHNQVIEAVQAISEIQGGSQTKAPRP
jgi:hypothetical protein